MPTLLQQLNDQLPAVVERARCALVQIHNGARGNGAGTIWHPAGLIVTNAHVVAEDLRRGLIGRAPLTVTLPSGETKPATVRAADLGRDLAALSVLAEDLPTIELGPARAPRPGDWVLAVGHPWGVEGAVTGGVVIGLTRGTAEGVSPAHEWLAVDLHMRPGHSGGPLVDTRGRLVGINTMIAGPDVGYAIPLGAVKAFLKQNLTR